MASNMRAYQACRNPRALESEMAEMEGPMTSNLSPNPETREPHKGDPEAFPGVDKFSNWTEIPPSPDASETALWHVGGQDLWPKRRTV